MDASSARRDYMINRVERPYPDDSGHIRSLETAGAVVFRGEARLDGTGRVIVRHDETEHLIETSNVVIGVGSETKVPPIEGIDTILTWTNREATGTRDLPASLLVLGGGPTGVELAQVFARFGVPVTVVQSGERLLPADHPRNSMLADTIAVAEGKRLAG
ncbi:MAG: FAD-dependent oxidoreductase [Candidatus Limnocylindrales bacterium]